MIAFTLSIPPSNMTDHTLERSWWLQDPPMVTNLPPSSLMSFTKYSIIGSQKIMVGRPGPRHPNGHENYQHTEAHIPQRCIIQIGSSKLHLHAKWLPLMMLIQLIQAAALSMWLSDLDVRHKKKPMNMLRLMWFYDFLLQRFAQDALAQLKASGDNIIPDGWMPDSMHRCLTRIELKIPHSPAMLEHHSLTLDEVYRNCPDHFSHGGRCS
jgi:hypothetical protein